MKPCFSPGDSTRRVRGDGPAEQEWDVDKGQEADTDDLLLNVVSPGQQQHHLKVTRNANPQATPPPT